MGEAYRVFTISSGKVTAGAVIDTLHLKGAGTDIPAIMVGEEGRGRQRGVVPVANPPQVPCPERGKNVYSSADTCGQCGVSLDEKVGGSYTRPHPDTGVVRGLLLFATIGQTMTGNPKFFARDGQTTDEKIVVVFNTGCGFRGGNRHTGDRTGWKCRIGCDGRGTEMSLPDNCPVCGQEAGYYGPEVLFNDFPGEILAVGRIAQGAAGRAGGGEQLVALMPRNVVFRTAYTGRLYGTPGSHYYRWDGEKLLSVTWKERVASDLF